jgi:glutathione S-transferase
MLKIYGVPPSVNTRKVIVTALHKNIDYQLEVVVPVVPGQPPANWGSISPTGLIPIVEDGDYRIGDSTAIALYLEKKQPAPAILPSDTQQYGQVLWLDAYVYDTLWRQVVHPLFGQTIVSPNIKKIPTDKAVVDNVLNEVAPKIFGHLESQIDGKYLVGNGLTLADVTVTSNFMIYQYMSYTIDAASYPRLTRYLRGIMDTEPFQKSIAVEKPFAEQMGLDRSFLN